MHSLQVSRHVAIVAGVHLTRSRSGEPVIMSETAAEANIADDVCFVQYLAGCSSSLAGQIFGKLCDNSVADVRGE